MPGEYFMEKQKRGKQGNRTMAAHIKYVCVCVSIEKAVISALRRREQSNLIAIKHTPCG